MTRARSGGAASQRARTRARRAAVQALYQWLMTGRPMPEIVAEFEQGGVSLARADRNYFRHILVDSERHAPAIDQALGDFLDRGLHELDPVTRAVLHLGVYELKYQLELPRRVVLNEAIELARTFGAENSTGYVNGVLDAASRRLRPKDESDRE